MNKSELLSYLLENNTSFSIYEVLIGAGVTLILALFEFFIYKKTYRGVMYSHSFNITLLLTAVITSMVMMIIGSNLALSLGMVGALSIIRFRTAIKEPKDIAFLFWSIAIGLSCGTGIYSIGIVGSAIIAILLITLSKGGLSASKNYMIVVHMSSDNSEKIEEILKDDAKDYCLKIKNITGNAVDATYEIRLSKKTSSLNEIGKKINAVDNVNSVNIVEYNGEVV